MTWLARRAIAGVEEVDEEGQTYRRSARVDGRERVVELRPGDGGRAPRLFGLDVEVAEVARALSRDPWLAPLVAARPLLRVAGCFDGFELAVRAVLGQQVSVAGGRTLAERIVRAHGDPLAEPRGTITHLFPRAETLAGVDLGGMPASRARAIRALAAAVADGLAIEPEAGPAEVRAALLELPGIGPWTVEYVAMRALRDPDAFPAGDLVLRNAAGGMGARDLEARAEGWRPWRAYAAMHLWVAASPG